MDNLNNSTIVKNIYTNQKEILWNIKELHNNGEDFECDMTYSKGVFYKNKKDDEFPLNEPKYKFDVVPCVDGVESITPFNKLPLGDNSIQSIVVDLPFVISPKTCPSMTKDDSCLIAKRFSSWYPAREGYENMYWWIKECYRVLKDGGICVWKMQSTVSGGLQHWYTPFCFMSAQKLGFYVLDEFILESQVRLISKGKYKKQQHARKYTSTFWVFCKDKKRTKDTNDCFKILDECFNTDLEGKMFELK